MNSKGTMYTLFSLLCLLLGSVIYLVYRQPVFIIHKTLSTSAVSAIRAKLTWIKEILPGTYFVKNILPDMLWCQSLLFLLVYLYHVRDIKRGRIFYFSFFLPLTMEFLQLLPFVPGTFDWLDVLAYSLLLLLNYFTYFGKKQL